MEASTLTRALFPAGQGGLRSQHHHGFSVGGWMAPDHEQVLKGCRTLCFCFWWNIKQLLGPAVWGWGSYWAFNHTELHSQHSKPNIRILGRFCVDESRRTCLSRHKKHHCFSWYLPGIHFSFQHCRRKKPQKRVLMWETYSIIWGSKHSFMHLNQ